jgi:hypothetical protein
MQMIKGRECILVTPIRDQWPTLQHTVMIFDFHPRGHFIDRLREGLTAFEEQHRQCYLPGA